ncbi:MAG: DUF488 domain-containing protein [Candidatus Omnitrophica bacterium]|nr:DUF488 domain-containing protein [Candidatus Omnitrophota bacterium]
MIQIKRVYAPALKQDGERVLVDRLWPRGLTKEKAKIDFWVKDIAPSDHLRKWFGHQPQKWPEFKKLYFHELSMHKDALKPLIAEAKKEKITLLYGAKDEWFNNAVALKEYIERKL